jgi:adenylyltransferase/sulfurtransferase
MNKETLKKKLKEESNLLLVDIRDPFECEDGIISDINIPLAQIMDRINELDTSKEIVFYCNSGKRSKALIFMISKKTSINNIDHLEGGYQAWIESN